MKKYSFILIGLITFFLATFAVVQYFNFSFLNNPTLIKQEASLGVALLTISLLIADVFLPVPASLIMIANGALFGIALGTALSLTGTMIASLTGFYIGKKSKRGIYKYIQEKDQEKAEALIKKWGMLAIVVTRPIPVLSETVSIVAGTTKLSSARMFFYSLAGLFPGAFIYALTGTSAANINNTIYNFLIVVGVAATIWLGGFLYSLRKDNLFGYFLCKIKKRYK